MSLCMSLTNAADGTSYWKFADVIILVLTWNRIIEVFSQLVPQCVEPAY